jgi:hypothetical protein
VLTGGGWGVVLLVVAALHLGFQLTVTCLVYPALAVAPAGSWTTVHAQHSRRIVPLVGVVYVGAVGASAGALLTHPGLLTAVAVGAFAVVLAVTALLAAPLHGRLAAGRTPALIHRLLRVDRVRTAFALVALVAAVAAVVR